MGLRPASEVTRSVVAIAATATNNPAARVAQLKQSGFSNAVRGTEAVLQGIQAAAVNSNKSGRELFFNLLSSVLNDDPTISNDLRRAAVNEDALRYSANTNYRQLFRLYMEDIQQAGEESQASMAQFDVSRFAL